MFHIVTVVGARPQFVKAAVLSRAIHENPDVEEVIIHTGQHFDAVMSDVFFEELQIPPPKYNLGIAGGSHGAMIGRMIEAIETILIEEKPDIVVVYGDTNSTLAAGIASKKLNIPVAHVEAGVRNYDEAMPEESNRYLVDRLSSLNFCCTSLGMTNLSDEGYDKDGIASTAIDAGDLMYDAALHYASQAHPADEVMAKFGVEEGKFVVCTMHRASNVDDRNLLANIVDGLNRINAEARMLFFVHPRTRQRMEEFGLKAEFETFDPISYFELIPLVRNCHTVVTDSGGLVREAYFFARPSLLVLDYPLWPELVEANWCINIPPNSDQMFDAFKQGVEGERSDDMTIFGDGKAGVKILNSIVDYLRKA